MVARKAWKYSIFVMLIGTIVVGGYLGTLMLTHETHLIEFEMSSDLLISYGFVLVGGHNYEVVFSASDESYKIAEIEIVLVIFLNKTVDTSTTLSARKTASSSSNSDDYVSVSRSQTFTYTIVGDTIFTINGTKVKGDNWSVRIYQDVPESLTRDITNMSIITMVMILGLIFLGVIYGLKYEVVSKKFIFTYSDSKKDHPVTATTYHVVGQEATMKDEDTDNDRFYD